MHDDRLLTEARLTRFVQDTLLPARYARTVPLAAEAWDVPGEPVSFTEAAGQTYAPVTEGDPWGAAWATRWLRLTGTVPEGWGDAEARSVELLVDLGFTGEWPGFQCEGLAYSGTGRILKAVSPRNRHVPLKLLGAERDVLFYVEAAANPDIAQDFTFAPTPLGERSTAGPAPLYRLGPIVIAELDEHVQGLIQDVVALSGLMQELPEDQPRRYNILAALERMMDRVDPDDVAGHAEEGRQELAEVLARPANASAHRIVATGHAHIDSAWLWPVRETIRKCARTFANVLQLMEEHPDFVFACSSAQQLLWMKEHYPELFGRIKERAEQGRFVPVGGMWVESDTNMPGGEAMARQFVEGKTFFQDEFGVDCREAWLPDSFGYSAALPQIARSAGIGWFLTQKLSWNQVNRLPSHTFLWEGIDGSRLFTHFPPADTYNAEMTGAELAKAERSYRDHGRGNVSLLPFGYGDGGGGPTREMVAAAERTAELEGSPKVRLGSPRSFFEEAEAEYAAPAVWVGELYLELHRGTYTSQARTKQGNRRSEHLLREAELWAATAAVRTGASYPAEALQRLWRLVLLQQFHDILPGSAIAWVHRDAERNYAAIGRELEELVGAAQSALAGEGTADLVFNAAPHERAGVPALGAAPASAAEAPVEVSEHDGGYILDNGILRVRITADGLIDSLIDYASGRDAIAPGEFGNVLELFRDTPIAWDAWDIDEFYRRNVTVLGEARSVTLERGGWDAVVVVERLAGGSPVTQRLELAAGADALTIHTSVDWQEKRKLLKLGFALDVHADRSASETQFGHVFRPTHVNTSWEWAKFEICAHRWMHVGEPGYGVAIANDSTYGHDVTRAVRPGRGTTTKVRLSLLRSPTFPDPAADRGVHEFTVSVRPGSGIAGAVEEGYRTNLAPRRRRGSGPVEPLVSVFNPALVVEAVKLAADGSGDVVVRLYESLGERSTGIVKANFDAVEVAAVDLLEREPDPAVDLVPGTDSAELTLRPFQLVTLRFRRV